jgi:hypothetical protein
MKRVLLLGVPLLALVLGALWLYGRAPSLYVLEQECRRYQDERRERLERLERAVRGAQRAEQAGRIVELEKERTELLAGTGKRRIRGWEVALIPPGGRGPDPEGYLVAKRFDVSRDDDPPFLRGAVEVWVKPTGGLARLLHGWGLTP